MLASSFEGIMHQPSENNSSFKYGSPCTSSINIQSWSQKNFEAMLAYLKNWNHFEMTIIPFISTIGNKQ